MNSICNPAAARNQIVECGCNVTYTVGDDEDIQAHARHHAEFLRVTADKGHCPYGHRRREQLKETARALLRASLSPDDASVAAEMLVRAHYDRSLQRAIEHGNGAEHPSLASYAVAVAAAGQFERRVNAALLAQYAGAPTASGIISNTIWDPPIGEGGLPRVADAI